MRILIISSNSSTYFTKVLEIQKIRYQYLVLIPVLPRNYSMSAKPALTFIFDDVGPGIEKPFMDGVSEIEAPTLPFPNSFRLQLNRPSNNAVVKRFTVACLALSCTSSDEDHPVRNQNRAAWHLLRRAELGSADLEPNTAKTPRQLSVALDQ